MPLKKRNEIRDYIGIALAMLVGSIGWSVFLLPNKIAIGGIAGMSSVLYWGIGIPVEISFLAINAILLSLALKILGLKFCIKTIYASILFAAFVGFIRTHLPAGEPMLSNQPFMAAIIGAALLGSSIGIGLSCNGSTGGTDVIAAMINKYHDISLGKAILACDILVITSSYVVLHSWEQVLYGYVVLFVSSTCVDWVVNINRRSVQFFIISEKYEQIGKEIIEVAQRGCTLINGNGFYSGHETKLLFVIARQNESSKIFQIIDSIDPAAFVSQSSVVGVYGLGFEAFKAKKRKEKASVITKNTQDKKPEKV